jgi:prepilin-type N-terminal cleavage/methylation domain-containing protein
MKRTSEKGFTLIEILLAVFVGLLLMAAAYVTMNAGQKSSAAVERKIAAMQDARAALQLLTLELSMVSYNPNFATGIWRDWSSSSCGASSNQTYRGLQEATATSVILEMDLGAAGLGSGQVGDQANEMIRYEYKAGPGNQYITREQVNCTGGSRNTGNPLPFLGASPASGLPRTVRVVNGDLGISVFRYFDGAGNEILAASLPAQISNIRRIDVTLAVDTEDVDPNTGNPRRTIYTSSVILRNHGINYQ